MELGLRNDVEADTMTTIKDGFQEEVVLGDDLPLPPARLFERLAQIPGYTWDHSVGFILPLAPAGHVLIPSAVQSVSLQLRPLVSTVHMRRLA